MRSHDNQKKPASFAGGCKRNREYHVPERYLCGIRIRNTWMAEEKTPRYLIAIGLGFYWAWVTLVFYSDILLPNAGVTAPAIGDIWLMSTTIHMVTLLFCVIFAIQTTNLLSRRPIRLLFVVSDVYRDVPDLPREHPFRNLR